LDDDFYYLFDNVAFEKNFRKLFNKEVIFIDKNLED